MLFKFFYISLLALLVIGCSVKELNPTERQESIEKLTTMLLQLNKGVDQREAKDLATSSIDYAHQLAKQYRVVAPPLWHNTLINIGLKERGLCYQWSHDLLVYLRKRDYDTLVLHWVGANIGTYFEHNALSVSAKASDFNQSILLDAWRGSGNLYFIEFQKDKRYSWKKREDLN